MENRKKRIQITVCLEPEMVAEIDKIAAEYGRSRARTVEWLMSGGLEFFDIVKTMGIPAAYKVIRKMGDGFTNWTKGQMMSRQMEIS